MKLLEVSTENCPIGSTSDVVGTSWTLRIHRESFIGVHRFTDFQRRLGVSSALLTERLDLLVGHGILKRVPGTTDTGGRSSRQEYRLTAKGQDLYPVLTALRQWGETYVLGDGDPPVAVEHQNCGAPVVVELRCTSDHEVTLREVVATPGPGARRRPVPS